MRTEYYDCKPELRTTYDIYNNNETVSAKVGNALLMIMILLMLNHIVKVKLSHAYLHPSDAPSLSMICSA